MVADYEERTLKKHWRVMQRHMILYLIKKPVTYNVSYIEVRLSRCKLAFDFTEAFVT